MKKSTQKLPLILMLAVIIWFSVAFIIYPIIHVIYESFFENGQITFDAVGKILRSERAMVSIRNSVLTGVVIMVTTTIVGVLQVLLTDYFDLKGASFYRIVYMTPLVFGGLILNNGYLFVYGPNGIVTQLLMKVMPNLDPNWFTGAGAVFFVMTFGCTHQFMIFFRNAIRSLDNNIIDAAQNLGSQPLQILKNVVLPTVRPTLITLIIITFSTGLNAFAAPLMVGGKFQTIAPLILTFSQRPKSRDLAAILSILLGISQIVLLFVMTKNERRGNFMSISKTKVHFSKQQLSNPVLKVVAYVIAWVLVLIHGLPAVMIVLSSFLDTPAIARNRFSFDAMTLEHYTKVFTNPGNVAPLLRSVAYSAVAAVLVVLLILVVVRIVMHHKDNRFIRSLEYPFYLPWLVPALMIALGYIMAYDRPSLLLFGNSVIGAVWILPVAYMVLVMPTTFRYMKAAYYNIDSSLEDASRNLGAGSVRTFWQIILPAVLPTALALITLNFNQTLAEYNMSAFLYPPGHETLGIVIRNNSTPTATIDAKAINMVYSVMLMIINGLALYLVYGRGTTLSRRQSGIED